MGVCTLWQVGICRQMKASSLGGVGDKRLRLIAVDASRTGGLKQERTR